MYHSGLQVRNTQQVLFPELIHPKSLMENTKMQLYELQTKKYIPFKYLYKVINGILLYLRNLPENSL